MSPDVSQDSDALLQCCQISSQGISEAVTVNTARTQRSQQDGLLQAATASEADV